MEYKLDIAHTDYNFVFQYISKIKISIDRDPKLDRSLHWILSEVGDTPLLLGREVVFDSFDIKFIQAEERIEFEWRGMRDANETAT